jgi:recA bacterial DNA recombination protein
MAKLELLRYEDSWKPASALSLKGSESKFASLQLPALKHLLPKGLCRGIIAEVNGRRSSGRTAVALHVLAQATARGEACAVLDLYDSFHPASAQAAGVRLDRILWTRCHGNAEHAIRAADLVLHAGGFGVVLLDMCEANARALNRIPLSYWYRFRRAVENTPAILLICAESTRAKSCSTNAIDLISKAFDWSGRLSFLLLRGLKANATLRRAAGQSEPRQTAGQPTSSSSASMLQVIV